MKFRVDRNALAAAAKWVEVALPSRPLMPILAAMKVDATETGLALSTFDYQLGCLVEVPGVEVGEPGQALVPGVLFAQILASLPPGPVEVSLEDGGTQALVCGGPAEFSIAVMPLEDYPTLPDLPELCGTMDGEVFRSAVAKVAYACGASNEVNGVRLDGVRIETNEDMVTLVATDRYRIPTTRVPWERHANRGEIGVMVTPAALTGFAKAVDGPVKIHLSPAEDGSGVMGLSCGGRTLTVSLLAGEYPKWQGIVPKKAGLIAEVDVAEFTATLKRAQLVLDPVKPLMLTFMEGCIQVDARSLVASASFSEVIEAVLQDGSAEEMTCHFNPVYLLHALSAAPTERVQLWANGTRAALMTAVGGDGDYRHVLMPQRAV